MISTINQQELDTLADGDLTLYQKVAMQNSQLQSIYNLFCNIGGQRIIESYFDSPPEHQLEIQKTIERHFIFGEEAEKWFEDMENTIEFQNLKKKGTYQVQSAWSEAARFLFHNLNKVDYSLFMKYKNDNDGVQLINVSTENGELSEDVLSQLPPEVAQAMRAKVSELISEEKTFWQKLKRRVGL